MKKLLLCLAAVSLLLTADAQTDTIRVGQPFKNSKLLKPTTRQYVRYLLTGGKRIPVDIWTRKVSFETVDGKPLVRIYQQWDAPDTTRIKVLDSWFEPNTLRPLTHDRLSGKTLEAFTFTPSNITGAPKSGNTKTDFNVASPFGTFNFETDMEYFQVLPLKVGYVAVMNFYHAGAGKPEWYTFKVDGSETVKLASGETMDCWIVSTDYNSPKNGRTRYWLQKGTQLFVKQETPVRNGFLYKMIFTLPE